jgi:hypothetical protein
MGTETNWALVEAHAAHHWAGIETDPLATSDAYHERKADQGKPNYDLLPPEAYLLRFSPAELDGVVRVLEFGAQKYAAHSWQDVPDGLSRYRAAARRHVDKIQAGEIYNDESGLPNIAHFRCNLIFVFALLSRGVQ